MKMNERIKKGISSLLAASMLLSWVPTPIHAAESDGLCTHHTAHTDQCGYVAAVEGVPCACADTDDTGAIVHAENCGYVAAVEEVACTYECAECAASSQSEETDTLSGFEYTISDSSVVLTKYTGSDAAVTVADSYTIEGTEYATVLDTATVFTGNDAITSVTIGSGVGFKDNSMAFLFYRCHSLTSVDMTGVDTSRVTTMESLFDECKKLTTITGYENWDTASLTSMFHTFDQTNALTTLDLSAWDLSKVENTGWCFQQCYATEIKLPDNIKTISAGFMNHAEKITGTSFTIPSGVQKIGYAHTFYNFATEDFVEFVVAEGNTYYKVEDGILYSADGTELLAIPRGKTFTDGVFTIPEGVTFLGELSFSRNQNITKVVLPDSFVIEYVPLNDARYIVYEDTGNINTGTNLSIAIYTKVPVTSYAVNDTNPNYASKDGIIYSKDMTQVVAIPARYAQEISIPEGVTTWNKEALWADTDNNASSTLIGLLANCTGVTIPASLTNISEDQLAMLNLLYTSRADSDNAFTITVAEGNTYYNVVDGQLVENTSSLTATIDTGDSVTIYDNDRDGLYEITNANDLYAFAALVNGGNTTLSAELTADIVVNTELLDESLKVIYAGRSWTPVGSTSVPFNGTFDGNGYTISGLYCSLGTGDYESNTVAGLFGYLGSAAVVQKLGILDSYITADAYAGGIAAESQGTVTNCFMRASRIAGRDVVGGIVPYAAAGTVSGCYADGALANATAFYPIACAVSATVANCVYKDGMSSESAVEGTTAVADFSTGEAAYLLGSGWGQTLGTDSYPVLGGATVYRYTDCQETVNYSNTDLADGHAWTDGTCTVCNAVCGTDVDHTGGTATCTTQAVCENCGASYGDLAGHSYVDEKCTGCGQVKTYALEYWAYTGGGTITGPASAAGGETVTVTVTPDAGYLLDCVTKRKVYLLSDGDYDYGYEYDVENLSFTMDWCDTQVKAYFKVCDHSGNTNSATDNGDGTHKYTCSACALEITAEEHSGGQANCTTQANCALCGASYGDLAGHSYVDEKCTGCGQAKTYAITYTVMNDIGGTVSGPTAAAKGEEFTVTVTPDVGYVVNYLYAYYIVSPDVDDYSYSQDLEKTGDCTFVMVDAAVTVRVKFAVCDHSESLAYTAGDATITETCEKCKHSATLTLSAPESLVYDGTEKSAVISAEGFVGTYEITYSGERTDVTEDGFTATVTVGEATAALTLNIQPKVVEITKVIVYSGEYGDETLRVSKTELENIVEGDSVYFYPDAAIPESIRVGEYTTVKGIRGEELTGNDAANYCLPEGLESTQLSATDEYNDYYSIDTKQLYITVLDQTVTDVNNLDQTAYTLDKELPTGHTLTGITLVGDETTKEITVAKDEDGNIQGLKITNAGGEDVTDFFYVRCSETGRLTITHEGHSFNADGFCATGECKEYQSAVWNEDAYAYEISNAGQLYWFAEYINSESNEANAILMNDIVVPESAPEWTPMVDFYGTFDGNLKTVSGLTVSSGEYAGMFGGGGYAYGTIQNLHLTDSSFTGTGYVGGIAGYHAGTIENCCVTNITLSGGNYMGALVGSMGSGSVINCYAYADTLIGDYSDEYTDVKNSYYLSDDTMADRFASGEIAYLLQAGVTGEDVYDEDGNYVETVTPLVWGQDIGTEGYPVLGGAEVYKIGPGGSPCSGGYAYANDAAADLADYTFPHSFDANGFCTACDTGYEQPKQDEEGTYLIANAGNLYWFAQYVNEAASNGFADAKLTADIVVNADLMEKITITDGTATVNEGETVRIWTPIGISSTDYRGTFDGDGKTVSGLYFNDSATTYYVGLFGSVYDGTVKNLGVKGSYFCGKYRVGGVAGYVTGSLTACHSSATVTGSEDVGGVAGYVTGSLTDCHNSGTVSGDKNIGGVAGYMTGSLTDCSNSAIVTGSNYVGGVVGDAYESKGVTGCWNTGTVSGSDRIVGGVAGQGGILSQCYNIGDVTATTGYAGGVAAIAYEAVTNCYNTGTVTVTGTGSARFTGGVTGRNDDALTNCYNIGTVTGNYNVGGVTGINSSTITNCFYLTGCAKDKNSKVHNGIGSAGSATADETGSTTGYSDFSTGEVAYLLQGDQETQVWGQNIDNGGENEGHPVFSEARVYYGYADCQTENATYSNSTRDTELSAHSYENGICANTLTDGTACGVYQPAVEVTADNCAELGLSESYGGYYAIANAGQLFWFAELANGGTPDANGVLIADVDLDTLYWRAMGTSSDTAYTGTFDGRGYSIKNMNRNNGQNEGSRESFVYYLGAGGCITNVVFDAPSVFCQGHAGANSSAVVALRNYGTISNCMVIGGVVQLGNYAYLAGIAGVNETGGIIENCGVVNTELTRRFGHSHSRAAITHLNNGTVRNCFAYGCVYNNDNDANGGIIVSGNAPENCYYYTASTVATTYGTAATEAQFTSGEIAYALGEAWGQTIGEEGYPIPDGEKVYYGYPSCAEDATAVYSNTEIPAEKPDHSFVDGKCECGAELLSIDRIDVTDWVAVEIDGDIAAQYKVYDDETGEETPGTAPTAQNPGSGGPIVTDGQLVGTAEAPTQISVSVTEGESTTTQKWTHNGTDWAGESGIIWNESQQISAYWPYGDTTLTLTIGSSDYYNALYAAPTAFAASKAALTMGYLGSKIVIKPTFGTEIAEGDTIASIILDGQYSQGTYDPNTGAWTYTGDATNAYTMHANSDGSYELIVVPQAEVTMFSVYVTMTSGAVYSAAISGVSTESGKQYNITLQVGEDAVVLNEITADPWRGKVENTTFANGDEIVVKNTRCETGNQAAFITDGAGNWNAEGTLLWIDSSMNQFQAWYPRSASYDSFTIPTDQRTEQRLRAADWMTASTEEMAKPDGDTLNLDFQHKLAKLTVVLKSEGTVSGAKITSISTDSITGGEITPFVNGTDYTAIVAPGTYSGTVFTFTLDGTEYTVSGSDSLSLSAGEHTTVYVDVDSSGKAQLVCESCTYTYTHNEDGETHTKSCSACGYETTEAHSAELESNKANCAKKATCDLCQTEYGELGTHIYENGFCTVCGDYEQPSVDEDGTYLIDNAGKLYWFAKYVNAGNVSVSGKLTDNIVVNKNVLNESGEANAGEYRPWTPIGDGGNTYAGTFDGGGKTVSGLYVSSTEGYIGFFGGIASGGTVKNVGVIDSYIHGNLFVGGVAAVSQGTVTNCYNAGTVIGNEFITGGVVGYTTTTASTVIGCYNTGKVAGGAGVGGVVGCSTGAVTNCYNTGAVSGNDYSESVGGVVGQGGTVTNCYNTGTVTATGEKAAVGSVVGDKGNVTNCYYLSDSETDSIDGTTAKTSDQFASGEVCWLLSSGVTDGTQAFYQTCGEGLPAFTGDTVYAAYTTCDDASVEYTNTQPTTEKPDHTRTYTDNGDNHTWTCSVCQATATEDHSYENNLCVCGHAHADAVALLSKNGVSVSAYTSLSDAINAVSNCTAEDNAVVKLLAAVDLGTDFLSPDGVFTLDLNGYTISGSGEYMLYIYDNGTVVTVMDSGEGGTMGGNATCGIYVENGGVILNGGTITGTDKGIKAMDGTVTINGGTVSGTYSSGVNAFDGSTVTITGGSITGGDYGVDATNCTLEITGGEITGGQYGVYTTNSTTTISGGEITGGIYDIYTDSNATITLTLAEGATEGATFPDGIRVEGTTLNAILGEGAVYSQNGVAVTVDDLATSITGGDVTIAAQDSLEKLVSLTIEWGAMTFTYDDTADDDGNEIGWTSGDTGWVSVENTGDTSVTITPVYANAEGFDFTAAFTLEDGTAIETASLAATDTKKFFLNLTGKPQKALSKDTIGTVTIQVS